MSDHVFVALTFEETAARKAGWPEWTPGDPVAFFARIREMFAREESPEAYAIRALIAAVELRDLQIAELEQKVRAPSFEDSVREAVEIRERLAAYAHEAWSEWMRHQFERATMLEDGPLLFVGAALILKGDVDRWKRQMRTPYADLPEDEKASDRVQADKILAILRGEG